MKASELQTPIALNTIFAENNSNSIAVSPTGNSFASQEEGFPPITMIPISAGGEAPHGKDFNGFLKILSSHEFYAQNGGLKTFEQKVSDAIGGYPKNAYLWYFPESTGNVQFLRSAKDDNTDNFVLNPSVIGTSWINVFNEQQSTTGNVGDINFTCRTDVPFGAAWCDGSEYLGTQYPQVWQMLQNSNLPNVSYEEYANQITTNGVCGVFGLDATNQKFKVPTIKGVYLKADENSGTYGSDSLPNIKAQWNFEPNATSYSPSASGAGTMSDILYDYTHGQNTRGNYFSWIGFDASKYSSVYQDGADVNPKHISYKAYIVLYTGVKDFSIIDYTDELQAKTDEGLQALANAGNALRQTQISNCVIESPNGVAEFSGNTITVKNGLKVLIPNGRNLDGSLNNIEYTLQTDANYQFTDTRGTESAPVLVIGQDGNALASGGFKQGDTLPGYYRNLFLFYNTQENKTYINTGSLESPSWTEKAYAVIGNIKTESASPYNITSFVPFLPVDLVKSSEIKGKKIFGVWQTGWFDIAPSAQYSFKHNLNLNVFNDTYLISVIARVKTAVGSWNENDLVTISTGDSGGSNGDMGLVVRPYGSDMLVALGGNTNIIGVSKGGGSSLLPKENVQLKISIYY